MKPSADAHSTHGQFSEENIGNTPTQDGQLEGSVPRSAQTDSTTSLGEKQPDGREKEEERNVKEALGAENRASSSTSINEEVDIEKRSCRLSPSDGKGAADGDSQPPDTSGLSMDPEGNVYPEGGLQANLVVFGSFIALFGTLGLVNSVAIFVAWISTHQLKDYSDGSIAWIFGIYAFLMFFCGVQIGPVFDAKGPRFLVLAGSILVVVSIILFGFCTQYWHFMVAWGVVGGIGMSLIFTPAIASPGHFFYKFRGAATGVASTGGSLGGVVFPLMLQELFPKIGWAWGTRVVALIVLISSGVGCLLIKSRLPKKKATKENILPDARIFRDPLFTLTTMGIFFTEWGLFIPITYISSYALSQGMSEKLSYQVIALLNVGSCFGRWIPGFTADYIGRFNTMILTVALCLLSIACLWLPAGDSVAMLVVFALVFGFASGSNIGLTPVCVGQVCKTEHYGRYYATAYTVVSFGLVISFPTCGINARVNC
ncbi:hypothetical protein FQN53_003124 [Emmonsiellopsis sp. PD_33]|nr:hypothetical protein FQN53_003124 [Emmonsiellopsis sp. PD_33]